MTNVRKYDDLSLFYSTWAIIHFQSTISQFNSLMCQWKKVTQKKPWYMFSWLIPDLDVPKSEKLFFSLRRKHANLKEETFSSDPNLMTGAIGSAIEFIWFNKKLARTCPACTTRGAHFFTASWWKEIKVSPVLTILVHYTGPRLILNNWTVRLS